ncbi:MAG: ABC transporter ATP-binding protein [Steroidobacterales bacterium]
MAAISVRGVSKQYGSVPVLRGIDLEISDGEFVVLVGPSGCGKSTLLRLIAGLEEITTGEIRIDGRVINDLAPKERDLAMVFQSYALYPHMTVRENLSFGLRLRGIAPTRIDGLVQGVSAKLGLIELMERKPRELSGGQRQRVAMGRAIVREPKAFLFDEPLSNLDARLREQMRYEIRRLYHELRTTSVYVTHDQVEAMTMADRIVAMNDGVMQQIGPPQELYDDPANLFVAGFIGSPAMNLLDATLAESAGSVAVMIGRDRLAEVPRPARMPAEGRVIAGIRPERISIGAVSGGIAAEVELLEATGLGIVLHVRAGGQSLKIYTTERLRFSAGETVGLGVSPSDLLLFDPDSGLRLRSTAPRANNT